MRTSEAGSRCLARPVAAGFTLLELLVVVAIIAVATAGVSFALRDSNATQLEREAQRLAALLESARAQSRSSGVPVRWYPVVGGFRFEGVAENALPDRWLDESTQTNGSPVLLLGPEPIIGRQEVVLVSPEVSGRSLRVATDGLRPFSVSAAEGQ
jgi:general secretion pathway protein H